MYLEETGALLGVAYNACQLCVARLATGMTWLIDDVIKKERIARGEE